MLATVDKCRICGNDNLVDLIDLGMQAITSRFPGADEPDPPVMPVVVCRCTGSEHCGLVQMRYDVPAEEMYLQTYGYRSGLNESMVAHIRGIAEYASSWAGEDLGAGDIVLDIGSNDGTLLSFYPQKLVRLGIDPTASQFRQYYSEGVVVVEDFFSRGVFVNAMGANAKAKCVTSISMFYDLPDPMAFVKEIASILDPIDGVWVMEQSYMPSMLATNSFDTICHEHLEYYSLAQIKWMADRSGLRIVDVQFNECNGGSFRVALCCTAAKFANSSIVNDVLAREEALGLATDAPYRAFQDRCEDQKRRLCKLLSAITAQGRSIYLYGASTKGNTLLQYYGIDRSVIRGAAERNPIKYGRRTPGTNIPIMPEDEVRKAMPDFMLVLPWHFKSGFLVREADYLKSGGQFIFPLPHVAVESVGKRVFLISGGRDVSDLLLKLKSEGSHCFGSTSLDLSKQPAACLWHAQPAGDDEAGWRDIIEPLAPAVVYIACDNPPVLSTLRCISPNLTIIHDV